MRTSSLPCSFLISAARLVMLDWSVMSSLGYLTWVEEAAGLMLRSIPFRDAA